MADIKETIPFSFDELYTSIQEKFETAGYDTEEGSNTSQLITAMAYLTSMLNTNTAVNINETILSTATKRKNILQDARALGYEIQHKQSYTYMITLALGAGDHTIPKYTKFTAGDYSYYYTGNTIELSNWEAGNTIELTVIEGNLYKYSEYPESLTTTISTIVDDTGEEVTQYYVDIPYVNVEENGIDCFVTYYDDYGNLVTREEYSRSEQFMIDDSSVINKQFVRLDDIDYGTPRIYFKLAGIGNGLRLGSIVELNVLVSNGVNGVIEDTTSVGIGKIKYDIENSTIQNIKLLTEGADEESDDSIKSNASLFYNSANRAVTKLDYEAICNRQATVNKSIVWGGDDEFPKIPGHVWFSFLPSKFERNFTLNASNYEYLLDDWGDIEWDYTLASGTVAYNNQSDAADEFYTKRFLEDSEIISTEYNDAGELIQPGIWNTLENYKIPTLEFHNRHPLFLDFEYDVNILKYNITDSKAAVHETVFNAIDNFFTGTDDTVKMETFETEYFHSSLEKRIDIVLTDITGYTNNVTTKLLLTKKNISSETQLPECKDIFVPLALPFETIFDNNGFLLFNMLPSIDTNDFIEYNGELGGNIYTDWTSIQEDIFQGVKQSNQKIIRAPIVSPFESTVTIANDGDEVIFEDAHVIITDSYKDEYEIYINDELIPNDDEFGWSVNDDYYNQIILNGIETFAGDVVVAKGTSQVGEYLFFNSHKKYIIVQLFINNAQKIEGTATDTDEEEVTYTQTYIQTSDGQYLFSDDYYYMFTSATPGVIVETDEEEVQEDDKLIFYTTPKSYLNTTEGFYIYTKDGYYFNTLGYSSYAEDTETEGIRIVSPTYYAKSRLSYDLFRRNRYLNISYNSPNFGIAKNVIPRLKRVTFKQGA